MKIIAISSIGIISLSWAALAATAPLPNPPHCDIAWSRPGAAAPNVLPYYACVGDPVTVTAVGDGGEAPTEVKCVDGVKGTWSLTGTTYQWSPSSYGTSASTTVSVTEAAISLSCEITYTYTNSWDGGTQTYSEPAPAEPIFGKPNGVRDVITGQLRPFRDTDIAKPSDAPVSLSAPPAITNKLIYHNVTFTTSGLGTDTSVYGTGTLTGMGAKPVWVTDGAIENGGCGGHYTKGRTIGSWSVSGGVSFPIGLGDGFSGSVSLGYTFEYPSYNAPYSTGIPFRNFYVQWWRLASYVDVHGEFNGSSRTVQQDFDYSTGAGYPHNIGDARTTTKALDHVACNNGSLLSKPQEGDRTTTKEDVLCCPTTETGSH
jgi:hypothetical protein